MEMDTFVCLCRACGMQSASNSVKCEHCKTTFLYDENSTPSEDWEDAFRFIEEAELRGDVYNIETIAKAHSCTTADKVDIVQPVEDEIEIRVDNDDESRDRDPKHASDSKTGSDLYRCCECPIRFKRKAALEAHFNSQHRRDESDPESKNSLSSSPLSPVEDVSALTTNLEGKNDDISYFQCDHCNGLLSSARGLRRHKSRFHKTDSTSAEAESAEESLSVLKRILAHKGNDIFFFECEECKTCFSSMSELRKHTLRVHKTQSQSDKVMPREKAQNPLQSSFCEFEEIFPEEKPQISSQSLVDPEDELVTAPSKAFEQNRNEFQCDVCETYLSNISDLKQHKFSVHNIDPGSSKVVATLSEGNNITCDVCKQVLSSIYALERHKRLIHTGKKHNLNQTFTCKVCKKKFSLLIALKNHKKECRKKLEKKTFNCKVCEEKFSLLKALKNHEKEYHKEIEKEKMERLQQITYTCEVCKQVLSSIHALERHKRVIHTGKNRNLKQTFTCKVCKEKFSLLIALKNHKKECQKESDKEKVEIMEEITYICDVCKQVLSSLYALERHKRVIHTGKNRNLKQTFTCKVCKEKFSLLIALKNHKKEFHTEYDEERETLRNAQRVDSHNLNIVKQHKSSVNNIEPGFSKEVPTFSEANTFDNHITCDVCKQTLSSIRALLRHKRLIHSGKKRNLNQTFTCNFCNEKFSFLIALKNHKKEYHKEFEKERVDRLQQITYKYRELRARQKIQQKGEIGLNKHKKNLHTVSKRPEPKRYKCRFCGKQFVLFNLLINHQRPGSCKKFRLGKQTFACDVCGKRCSNKFNLTVHQQSRHKIHAKAMAHYKKQTLRCEKCQKEFNSPHNFENHKLLHTASEYRHKCDICSISFLYKANLLKHSEIHTGEKPFKCEHCHETFRIKRMKDEHKHVCKHANRKTSFSCTSCRRSFPRERFLILHRRLKHNIEPLQT